MVSSLAKAFIAILIMTQIMNHASLGPVQVRFLNKEEASDLLSVK